MLRERREASHVSRQGLRNSRLASPSRRRSCLPRWWSHPILSLAAVYQVREEYPLARRLAGRSTPVSAAEIRSLQRDVGTRIIIRSTALAALVFCTVATLWLQQRQFAVRRTLSQIKLFARDILASMDEGVITTDQDGTITSVNSAAIGILGVGSDCVGQPLAYVSAAVRLWPRWPAKSPSGTRQSGTGISRWIRVDVCAESAPMRMCSRLPAGGALGCLFLLRDVSDRVLIEERIRRMERIISLGTLASGLHHEIKNPLTALSIHVQLLDKRLRDPEPQEAGGRIDRRL